MLRSVTAELDLDVADGVDLIFSLAVARTERVRSEELTFTAGADTIAPVEIPDVTGTRLHRVTGARGPLTVRYRASVDAGARAVDTSALELITYLRPSRYSQSDEVFARARRQFSGLRGLDLLRAVETFVAESVTYAPDATGGTDSAVTTLASGRGVCRDYAHVVIALLRAMDVPARYVACYAPGLAPMDFHAVAEAYVDGAWYVLDATHLADRRTLVRIATGRDAADCAFLSFHGGYVGLDRLRVDAWLDPGADAAPEAPDDHRMPVRLA